jgi:ABC-type Mn2+/Zn2+ transport system permease subunit
MIRPILLTAVLTGVFCSVFAVGIDYVVDMLERGTVIVVSFFSGFLGSLFAQTVLGRWKENRK